MNIKLIHPLWTHIPVILILLAVVFFTVWAFPLPDPAPLHFTASGQPDRYGSLWMSMVWQAGIAIMYIIISIILDEAWARQEKRKSFNWLALFDDVIVAALATVQITYVNMLISGTYSYPFPWELTLLACTVAAAVAIVLEKIRPFRAYQTSLSTEDVGEVKMEVERIVQENRPLAYWEVQDPVYSRILAVVVPLIMVIVAVTAWAEVPWLSILMAVTGLFLVTIYGGFMTMVTRKTITVRMGILGIQLLKLKTPDIASAELHNFQPLKDFGGYGIRFNKEMTAYYLTGNRGVKITTRAGKKYLIGTDHPERMATVISTIIN